MSATDSFATAFGSARGLRNDSHVAARRAHDRAMARAADLAAEPLRAAQAFRALRPYRGHQLNVLIAELTDPNPARTYAFLTGVSPRTLKAVAVGPDPRVATSFKTTKRMSAELVAACELPGRFREMFGMAKEPLLRQALIQAGVRTREELLAGLPVWAGTLETLKVAAAAGAMGHSELERFAARQVGADDAARVLRNLLDFGLLNVAESRTERFGARTASSAVLVATVTDDGHWVAENADRIAYESQRGLR